MSLRIPTGATYVSGIDGATENAGRLAWHLRELPPGEEKTFNVELAYDKAGMLQCEALASAAAEVTATAQCETRVEAIADLNMVVNDPQGPKAVGDEVIYEIRVTNRGSKAAMKVSLLGQFSNGVEPIRVEGATAELVPGQVLFQEIPRIEAGQTVALKIVARADKAGNHRFRSVLKCADPETELIAEDMTRFFGDEKEVSSGGTRPRR
jgi:hypothetical protein